MCAALGIVVLGIRALVWNLWVLFCTTFLVLGGVLFYGSSGQFVGELWFRAKGQLSSGVVEGFSAKAKLTTRKAYGFRTYHGLEVALYHALGALPEPKFTHKFS
jgi:hypothetical protein